MRIEAGHLKGRRIVAPAGAGTRPTSAKTRAALFDCLAHGEARVGLEGIIALDAFAGTGALGFETLSRGGAQAVFMDQAQSACDAMAETAEELGVAMHCHITRRNACRPGARPARMPQAGLVFADPPYGRALAATALAALIAQNWIAPRARIVVETEEDDTCDMPEDCRLITTHASGNARLVFLAAP